MRRNRIHPPQLTSRVIWLLICLFSFTFRGDGAEQRPANILLLFPEGRLLPALVDLDRSFRETVEAGTNRRLEFYSEFVESSRFIRPEYEGELLNFLSRKYSERKPDIIITMWGSALSFIAKNRQAFFPEAPVVACGITDRQWAAIAPVANATAVLTKFDVPATLRLAMQLQPNAKHVVTIIGVSPMERTVMPANASIVEEFRDRLTFEQLAGEPLPQLCERIAELPPDRIVLFETMLRDREGNSYAPSDVVSALAKVSRAPVYGMFETAVGRGIVGGSMYSPRDHGIKTAHVALRVLGGEKAEAITPAPAEDQPLVVDARQLKKWDLDEKRLPPGTQVRFRSASFWELYRWRIIAALSLITLQAGLIGALLVERRVRRRAEKRTQDLSTRLLDIHEDERRRVARELHDDITQRLARLSMDAAKLELSTGDTRSVASSIKNALATLSADAHALAYRLHPAVLEELGLVDALRAECARFSKATSMAVTIDQRGTIQDLPRETALCIFRIAQEGLQNVARHSKATRVDVTLANLDGGIQLALRDNGIGFNPAAKAARPSLGIPGMKERANLLGGELDVESSPGHGTAVIAWMPFSKQTV